jgi:SSS family solute:Na+ symporter
MQETTTLAIHANEYALAAFIFYLLIVSGIGIYATRFSSSGLSEYFLAGRKLKHYVVALSAVTSGRSAWLILAVSGMAYTRGISAVWAVVGYTVAELFLFLTAGRRLREYTEKMDSITIPDYFAARFKDEHNLTRILSVCIILIFMVAYVAAQFNAGGKAFAASFGFEPTTGVIVTATIVLIYTILGGFLAVSLTDFVQATFMIFALLVLPIVAIIKFGGFGLTMESLHALSPAHVDPFALSVGAFVGFLGIGLGSPGNPHILVRYMSIDDPKKLPSSAVIGTVTNILMASGALLTGLIGKALYADLRQIPSSDPENLFPYLAQTHLHPILFGLIIAAIFAAIMSTADSQLLVAASGVVRDIYQKIIKGRRQIDPKKLVAYSRIVVLCLVIVSLILGALATELVFWLVLFAWGGLGAAFGPALLFSLYWPKTTRAGVIAGFLTGTIVLITWNRTPVLKQAMYELVPAFILSALAVWLVSILTPKAGS